MSAGVVEDATKLDFYFTDNITGELGLVSGAFVAGRRNRKIYESFSKSSRDICISFLRILFSKLLSSFSPG